MKTSVWAIMVAGVVVAAGGGGSSSNSGVIGNGGPSASGVDDGLGYVAGPGPQGGATLYGDFRTGKKLVLHQREIIAVTPVSFRDRLTTMEAVLGAFDGVFLRLPATGDALTRGAAVTASAIAKDLEPLYALRPAHLKYNFAVVPMQRELDAFDDWSIPIANIAKLARVARDAGLVGIVIDDESLSGLRVNYPYDLKFQNRTMEDYRAQTQLVGKKIMQAIVTEFPDAAVVVLRGAAGAEPASPANLVNREADSAQLLGSFFAGFVEAKGARSLLVDGGTDYGLRTAEQFKDSADWRRTGLASTLTSSIFLSDALRSAWPSAVTISFGLRELDGAHGNLLPNDPILWASTLNSALRTADTFVWASFDLTDLTKAGPTDPWATAATRAKAAAVSATGALGSAAPASGTGLMAQYFAQKDESELAQTVVDPTIDKVWSGTGPINTILAGQNDNFSVVWSGYLEAPVSGTYTIFGRTDDGMQILIGGSAVVDAFYDQGPTEHAGTIDLVAGTRYPIKIRYYEGAGLTEAHVSWQPPGDVKALIPSERMYPFK
ncbi:MAG: PA14 domain-containing protein [Caldimonas sp.]